MVLLTTLLLSLFITIVLIPILKNHAFRLQTVDFPNSRSVHTFPKPRIGGIAMAMGAIIPVLLWTPKNPLISSLLVGSLIVTLFGFLDDQKNLGYKTKFAGQFLAAFVVILHGGVAIRSLGGLLPEGFLLPNWISVPFTAFVIVGVTNAINLSDGLDGLAGGIALLCYSCIGIVAYQVGDYPVAIISAAVIGAVFAFLRFNTYPAVIFMGDAGSLLLGFLAITLSISLSQRNAPLSPLFPMILLGFPVLDTLTVTVLRISTGNSPFKADQKHFHHKLLSLGFSHTGSVVTIYLLQAFLVTAAFIGRYHSDWSLLFFYVLFSGAVVTGFLLAAETDWSLPNADLFEDLFRKHLQIIRDRSIVIKSAYWVVLLLLPAMLHFTCLLPARIPRPVPALALGLAGFLFLVMLFKKRWLEKTIRLTLYTVVPYLVYQCQVEMVPWLDNHFVRFYNGSFLILVTFVLGLLKFTRRQNGFKTTPTDFLILFIALIVPNLPDAQIQSYQMGLFAAKLIAFLFSFEVLIGELRGELNGMGLNMIASLLIIAARGLI